jgi:beta-barrel assembly-enhancing protease
MTARMRLLAVLLLLPGCGGQLPSLSDVSSRESLQALARVGATTLTISPEKEAEIGRIVAGTVIAREPLLDDEAITRYVELVGHAVAEQSIRRGDVAFRFGVLDSDQVNAYAAPGGYIFVTLGTLAILRSEAQLAGILAHEVAHVDARHVVEELRRAGVLQAVREEADLTGPVLDRIAGAGSSLLFTGLAREDEFEADALGLLYASGSGYRAAALLSFLEEVARLEGDPGERGRFRSLRATHPPAGERLEAMRASLQTLPGGGEGGVELAERYRERVLDLLPERPPLPAGG